jgi:mono/diheme cytochrome c family protein
MKKWVVLLLLGAALWGEDFISEFEYGQMLYQNPRGVSCVPCHGDHGEGAIIARYKEHGKPRVLKGPDIRGVDLATLRQALLKGRGVMPRYFLTDKEIHALYLYIQKANRADEDNNGTVEP